MTIQIDSKIKAGKKTIQEFSNAKDLKDYIKSHKNETVIWNESLCECGHHSKDHSWSLAPKCSDMECDECSCQNFRPRRKMQ